MTLINHIQKHATWKNCDGQRKEPHAFPHKQWYSEHAIDRNDQAKGQDQDGGGCGSFLAAMSVPMAAAMGGLWQWWL